MTLSKPQTEWTFSTDHENDVSGWASLTKKGVQGDEQVPLGKSHRLRENSRLYELILGAAILYGAALFFVWQQAVRDVTMLEAEIGALRSEVSQIEEGRLKGIGGEGTDILNRDDGLQSLMQMETEYLHFEASDRTAELVKAVAPMSNAKHRQLHQDFGLTLYIPVDSLTIIVDPATNMNGSLSNERTLVVPFPKPAAERHGISERNVLINEIFVRLSEHVLTKALNDRTIMPQWQAMVLALKTHMQLENGHNRDWRADATLLSHRHLAHNRSLDLVQQMSHVQDVQFKEERQPSPTAIKIAAPLVEYILETYGYARVPALLDAFEAHGSWETVTLEVFNVSASEFEQSWHAFLKERYPMTQD